MKFIRTFIKDIRTFVRFGIIQHLWAPADHSAKPAFLQNLIKKYWSPSENIDISGQNSRRRLTDKTLASDLPFLLATKSGIRSLDLSHNQLGKHTLFTLIMSLPAIPKIKKINLSHNRLDADAQFYVPELIRTFTSLDFSHCNLSTKTIDKIIKSLKHYQNITELNISGNRASPAQVTEINELIERNRSFYELKTKYQKKDVVDLQAVELNASSIKHLAFYISKNAPHVLFGRLGKTIKEIKAPALASNLKESEFEPLIDALKKNTQISTLTMDSRKLAPEVEQKLRIQLMLNKAIKKTMKNARLPTFLGLSAVAIITSLSTISFWYVSLAVISATFAYRTYFLHRLEQAKLSDFSQPENAQAIECGKNSADSWLSYLNPKAYTPMAYLGYAIEREKLSTKYDVKAECFKPSLR